MRNKLRERLKEEFNGFLFCLGILIGFLLTPIWILEVVLDTDWFSRRFLNG